MNTKGNEEGDFSAGPGGSYAGAGSYALKEVQPMESPCRSRLLAGTTAHGRPTIEQRVSVRKKERQRGTVMSIIPILHPFYLCLSGWGRSRGEWSKEEPRKKREGGRC